ncbi:unnamed protein product, partial [Rotaria magnacalcarata]
ANVSVWDQLCFFTYFIIHSQQLDLFSTLINQFAIFIHSDELDMTSDNFITFAGTAYKYLSYIDHNLENPAYLRLIIQIWGILPLKTTNISFAEPTVRLSAVTILKAALTNLSNLIINMGPTEWPLMKDGLVLLMCIELLSSNRDFEFDSISAFVDDKIKTKPKQEIVHSLFEKLLESQKRIQRSNWTDLLKFISKNKFMCDYLKLSASFDAFFLCTKYILQVSLNDDVAQTRMKQIFNEMISKQKLDVSKLFDKQYQEMLKMIKLKENIVNCLNAYCAESIDKENCLAALDSLQQKIDEGRVRGITVEPELKRLEQLAARLSQVSKSHAWMHYYTTQIDNKKTSRNAASKRSAEDDENVNIDLLFGNGEERTVASEKPRGSVSEVRSSTPDDQRTTITTGNVRSRREFNTKTTCEETLTNANSLFGQFVDELDLLCTKWKELPMKHLLKIFPEELRSHQAELAFEDVAECFDAIFKDDEFKNVIELFATCSQCVAGIKHLYLELTNKEQSKRRCIMDILSHSSLLFVKNLSSERLFDVKIESKNLTFDDLSELRDRARLIGYSNVHNKNEDHNREIEKLESFVGLVGVIEDVIKNLSALYIAGFPTVTDIIDHQVVTCNEGDYHGLHRLYQNLEEKLKSWEQLLCQMYEIYPELTYFSYEQFQTVEIFLYNVKIEENHPGYHLLKYIGFEPVLLQQFTLPAKPEDENERLENLGKILTTQRSRSGDLEEFEQGFTGHTVSILFFVCYTVAYA